MIPVMLLHSGQYGVPSTPGPSPCPPRRSSPVTRPAWPDIPGAAHPSSTWPLGLAIGPVPYLKVTPILAEGLAGRGGATAAPLVTQPVPTVLPCGSCDDVATDVGDLLQLGNVPDRR